jgi:flagellar hook assembly protein FlgD
VATVAAVFITQHLKVTTPLIAGETYEKTPHWIVPTNPKCSSVTLYFHLLHSADSFNLDIVDSGGRVVRTLATDVPGRIKQPFSYSWNGRLDDGAVAPVGLYNFQLHLIRQDRTIEPEADFPISVQSACHM